jgi:hypothetical protein
VIQIYTVILNLAIVATHVVPQVTNANMEFAASVMGAQRVLAAAGNVTGAKNPFTTAYASVKFVTSCFLLATAIAVANVLGCRATAHVF